MRRKQDYSATMLLGYALAEIERLKAMASRITDGRVLVYSGTGGGVPGNGGVGVEPAVHVLYGSKHSKALRVTDDSGLDIDFEEGHARIDETYYLIAAGSLTLTDNDTNYVFVNNSGTVADNVTGFPDNSIPLATVVTSGGDISSVTDNRAYLWGHHGPAFAGTVTVDTINEYTGAAGVTIEGSLHKDAAIHPGANATFKLHHTAGLPYIQWDTNDFVFYWVGGNYWSWYVGAIETFRVGVGNIWPDWANAGTNFTLHAPGGDPRYTVDAGDYMGYWRAGNMFQWIIASAGAMSLTASGLTIDVIDELTGAAGVTIESNLLKDSQVHPGGDADYYLSVVSSNPRITFDTGDYMEYDRAGNDLRLPGDQLDLAAVGSYTFYKEGTGVTQIVVWEFAATTDDVAVRYFRSTNTSGALEYTIFKGDGTATKVFSVRGDTDQVEFGAAKLIVDTSTGTVVKIGNDADFQIGRDAGKPFIQFDSGRDGIEYVQATDIFDFKIGGASVFRVYATYARAMGAMQIDGDLNHDGSNIGFFGTVPAAQAAAYTPSNVGADRSYDADATTLDEIADVLGTLIADLQTYGLLQ